MKRGPDGSGFYEHGHISLAHCRLSIIDVSAVANQPMYSGDGRQHLKNEYFATHSDTEVFLKLFIKFGTDAFAMLRGFFAAAIHDRHTGSLFLVRDRFGKKPLLYYRDADALVFASEMKSLIAAGIPKKINWQVLPAYLQLNYIPQPYSMIENVRKLEPGTWMHILGSEVTTNTYYSLEKDVPSYGRFTYEEAQQQLVEKMDKAIQLRLIADVPLGAFLSGGIDSSVVVALASRHTEHLNTFSIGYRDHPFFDETKYAELVARKYDTNHTVFSLSNEDFVEHVFSVLDYIDEPFADSSAIPEFILSYHTRKHVTVALSGDGGDEVFAGYNKHAAEWRMRNRDWKTGAVAALAPLWKVFPKSRSSKVGNLFRQLNRYSLAANLSPSDRYWQWATLQSGAGAAGLLSQATKQRTGEELSEQIRQKFSSAVHNDFNDVLLADMNLVLLSDMLTKVDMMSMANSLEIRSPFIDQEVVSFAFGLPAEYKVNGSMKKRIVQDAFRSMLPAELYNRPKRGFEIPLRDWLRKEFWDLIDKDLMEDGFIADQGIFDPASIRTLKNKLRSTNPEDSHATVWAILVFQYWWRKYIA
jgi:asparagine synthase (glutamine-hydrolysing)